MSGEEKHNQPQPETLRKRRDEPSDATDVEKAASSSAVSVAEANDNHNDNHNDSDEEVEVIVEATWRELAYHWFVLGWTAFGGPAAHIGMYHRLFVEKLKWCSNVVFTELFMLGQCMPGPTSTQMGFAQGVLKKGLPGGLVSGALFQGPGLLILSALGWSLANTLAKNVEWLNGMVSGLAAAGIALVAGAAVSLNKKINNTRELQVISTTSAVIAFYWPRPWTFPCLILLGGLTSILMSKLFPRLMKTQSQKSMNAGVGHLGLNKVGGAAVLALWIAVLVAVLVAAGQTAYVDQKELHWFAAFYRTGSIIFGGGQVVLPMLYNDVVAADCANQEAICCPKDLTQVADQIGNTSGILLNQTLIDLCSDYSTALYADECKCSWMSASQFYFGLSAAQACPGPLFNFSAYLGAVIAQNAGVFAIAGIALCWVGLFAPGILIIFGILPWVSYASDVCFPHASVDDAPSSPASFPLTNSPTSRHHDSGAHSGPSNYTARLCQGSTLYVETHLLACNPPLPLLPLTRYPPPRCQAAVGLIISSVFILGTNAYISSPFRATSICIGIACFGFSEVLKVPAPFIVLGGGAMGVIAWAIPMQ